jgi:hypothetical protein
MKRLIVFSSLSLCAVLLVSVACALQNARGETKAKGKANNESVINDDLPVLIDCRTYAFEEKGEWDVTIRCKDRGLTFDSRFDTLVTYDINSTSGNYRSIDLTLNPKGPPLSFDKLPSEKRWYLKDCIDMASSALKVGKKDGTLLPIAIPTLEQIIARHFYIDDTFNTASISYYSHYKYVGSSKLLIVGYHDENYSLDIEETPSSYIFDLTNDDGSYAASAELKDRRLAAEARYKKDPGSPDEKTLLEGFRKAIWRATQLVANGQPGTMFADTDMLQKATQVFEKRESFDSYKLMDKPVEPSS